MSSGWNRLRNENGFVLQTSLVFMTVLALIGSTAIVVTTTDIKIGGNYKTSTQTFYLAETGLAVAEAEAFNDINTDQNLGNTIFNALSGSVTIAPSSSTWYTPSGFSDISFGSGTYTIQFKNLGTSPNFEAAKLLVRSTGTGFGASSVVLEEYLSAENISPWNNAVFANGGGGSAPITGNVVIAGSIHLLGHGLSATDTAFSNQTGDVRNTNTGMNATLAGKIAGGTTNDLKAKFRLKNGRVDMTVGSATIGASSSPFKGVYVTAGTDADGNGVNDGILGGISAGDGQNLYAGKGAAGAEAYDLGDHNITMPGIDTAWMSANALDLTGATQAANGVGLSSGALELTGKFKTGPTWYYPDIDQTDGTNSIHWDSVTNTLTINGVVKVSSLNISGNVNYAGRGTLYVTGNSLIDANVLPEDAASYPTTHVFGLVTAGNMTLGSSSSQLLLTGAYYAAGTATSSKQTELAGTILCNQFNITAQVPKLWQIPSLATNLPPGMPGATPVWVFTEKTWRQVLAEG